MLYIVHIYTMKDRIKDSYGNQVAENISFDEYWDQQHKLEALSNAESIRQKEERKSRMSTPTDAVSAKNGVRVKKE